MFNNKLVNLLKLKPPNLYKLKNIHIIKKNNCIECYYCNGKGWIIWKSNKSNNILDLSKQPNIILYTICSKCQ
jgi:hypothetical protein